MPHTALAPLDLEQVTIGEIEALDRAQLMDVWARIFDDPPPAGLSHAILTALVAYEVQARRSGRLGRAAQRQLVKAAAGKERRTAPRPAPGARLVREWNGITHTVDVVKGGFDYRGQRYRSLTRIAEAISGTHQSGPRFFGLTNRGARR